jgi:hypothetical protein
MDAFISSGATVTSTETSKKRGSDFRPFKARAQRTESPSEQSTEVTTTLVPKENNASENIAFTASQPKEDQPEEVKESPKSPIGTPQKLDPISNSTASFTDLIHSFPADSVSSPERDTPIGSLDALGEMGGCPSLNQILGLIDSAVASPEPSYKEGKLIFLAL